MIIKTKGGDLFTYHFFPASKPPPVIDCVVVKHLLRFDAVDARRELQARKRHGRTRLLQRNKGAVHINRNVVGRFSDRFPVKVEVLGQLNEQTLRMSAPKIETRCFEH